MATRILPVDASLRYFEIEYTLDGSNYLFDYKYHERNDRYYFDLYDGTRSIIVAGIKIVLNVPLLRKVVDLRKPPGILLAIDTSGTNQEAGVDDLGNRVILTYEEAS